jgi:hypothetical protein
VTRGLALVAGGSAQAFAKPIADKVRNPRYGTLPLVDSERRAGPAKRTRRRVVTDDGANWRLS